MFWWKCAYAAPVLTSCSPIHCILLLWCAPVSASFRLGIHHPICTCYTATIGRGHFSVFLSTTLLWCVAEVLQMADDEMVFSCCYKRCSMLLPLKSDFQDFCCSFFTYFYYVGYNCYVVLLQYYNVSGQIYGEVLSENRVFATVVLFFCYNSTQLLLRGLWRESRQCLRRSLRWHLRRGL
jgi:hypothetical protein